MFIGCDEQQSQQERLIHRIGSNTVKSISTIDTINNSKQKINVCPIYNFTDWFNKNPNIHIDTVTCIGDYNNGILIVYTDLDK